ncbi:MAG: hypothetical protein CMJ83_13860 [Planctomycetes bacterium]|nr:hypothetical protein [Planctomycetota bacterium]
MDEREQPDKARVRPSGRRRIARGALYVVFLAVLLELTAFAGFWIVDGRTFSYGRLSEERRRVAEGEIVGAVDANAQGTLLDMAIHPYVGYVTTTDADAQIRKMRGYGVNRHGFLDPNPTIRKRDSDRVLIGIFGGSVADALSFRAADVLVRKLEGSPRFRGRRIQLVRMAMGGYKQPQQLMVLTWLLALGGELDYAVNLDGFNEVALSSHNFYEGVYPYFPRQWASLVNAAPDRERQRRIGKVVHLKDERRRAANSGTGSATPWSVAMQLIWRLQDRARLREIATASESLESYRVPDLPFPARGPGVDDFTLNSLATPMAELWRRCSLAMHQICEDHGIRYLHLLQPNQYVPNSKTMDDEERRIAYNPELAHKLVVEVGYPALLRETRAMKGAGVAFHDLRMIFKDVSEATYEDQFCHLNQRGNELLAREVAAAILER